MTGPGEQGVKGDGQAFGLGNEVEDSAVFEIGNANGRVV